MIGKTIAHYQIKEELGRGGMGEVYRATDTKLNRDVALKILPEAFTEDPQRMARFDREAKVLAALNHPNVGAIYGLEESDTSRVLVLELIEGPTLADRIAQGPMPAEEALKVASQIARGLEAAQEKGIIHRDLKPANIKIREDGAVKVLDFGLAKASALSEEPATNLSQSPTLTAQATQLGVILGTVAYMSPEQARGYPVDHRSDVWAFGVVLYEMLTGRALFQGKVITDVIAAVVTQDPDWTALPENTPVAAHRLLRRCLARDPSNRIHHIADARIELEESEPTPLAINDSRHRYRITIGVLAVALIASLAAMLLYFSRPAADWENPQAENPFTGARFSKVTTFQGSEFDAAISPDGQFVAFASDRDGPFEIFVGQVGAGDFRKLLPEGGEFELEDAWAPVRSVGFNHDGSEVWLGGGPSKRIRSKPFLGGATRHFLGEHVVNVAWAPHGQQIVYHERLAGDPLYVADSNGTNSRQVLAPSAGTHQHFPVFSMDGTWIYVVRGRPATLEMDLWKVKPDGSGLEQLTHGKLDVRYPTPISERMVLYSARDTDGAGPWLWTLDVETRTSQRASVGLERYSSVSGSANGRRLVATVQDPEAGLWGVPILERTATEKDVRMFTHLATTRSLAPRLNGDTQFYLSSRGSGDGLWKYQDGRTTEIWRGSETALLEPAAVSPDGTEVVLLLRKDARWQLHTLRTDGTQLTPLAESVNARGAADWSPDGRWIVTGGYEAGSQGLFKIPTDDGPPERLVDGEALNPVWSPKGNLIVYTGAQVNVVSPLLAVRPNGEQVELPKIEVFRYGQRARFLPDGSGLVYMQGLESSQDFWLLDLDTSETRRLTQLDPVGMMRSFDITPDGTQIVFDRLSEDSDIVLIELEPL